ncbi:hypothetical protein S4054249_12895 [Pseudoalteromonas luteoviolacea]|uniref:Uncharacterized protein n=1 Tax=Pseudoalteromonas luteoviolacea S4054 TaxID=1129367 RepID=A0A0F6A8H5_9GAMM|nr:hypothetical protein S4054249_12895 [Pseudoalteromonas luteoviolacea]AOT13609.1 hypothetical protein S40542_12870 [Pseudoalteromonas luteoviolacea]AOT18522.1 hypothetical protein S4054_12870 [Pseudoalteromonas luteoviolacea]KKE82470.1 hypothetical protein N479_17845 [Pseudoalteromonas luteoviolacea S4054]KZN72007.1 hypothetical protein N481_16480 [Pseudoalteromonas luteoviolacea S4047-1]
MLKWFGGGFFLIQSVMLFLALFVAVSLFTFSDNKETFACEIAAHVGFEEVQLEIYVDSSVK